MLVETPMNIDPQSWAAWKNDPVTKEVMKALQQERDEMAQWLLEGRTLEQQDGFKAALETAKAVGVVYGFDAALIGVEEALQIQWEEARRKKIEGGE